MSYQGHFAAPKKKPGWKKVTLITLSVILLLVLLVAALGVAYWYNTIGKIEQAQGLEETLSDAQLESIANEHTIGGENAVDNTEPTDALVEDPEEYIQKTPDIINILLVGQDARGSHTVRLSDSMILCTINQKTKTLTMTSFLRDMYVKLPNYDGYKCGYNRINVCYSLGYAKNGTIGAMEMLDMCLLENFGVQVDYNIEVDFTAFEEIVDAMGGVDIELTYSEANHLNSNNGWSLQQGVNHLDGEQALAYARIRKIDSDFYRTNRQRNVISSLLDKCRSLSLLELQTLLPMVTTDMDSSVITDYALELLPLIADLEVVSQAIPAEDTYYLANKGTEDEPMSVIVPNLEENRQILKDTIGG